ncbi:hypothetical protein KJ762_00630 [bacterium]|nr:hypothetical protein [bacterium]MBU1063751.1 hypothetical protein [bacterium]MBU1632994.1 hypothetical protein [bacterium]MBU1873033.1 hypothetical protein [bacterium]
MKKKISTIGIVLIFILSCASAQTGTLTLGTNYFNNVEVFYIADFDFNNGMNNPDIFEYYLSYTPPIGSDASIQISIEFEMIANIPSLGLNNRRIIFIKTLPFDFNGEVAISTKNLDLNMDNIFYTDGREVTGIYKDEFEFIPEEEFARLQTAILSGLKLPAGDYMFNFAVYPEGSAGLSEKQVISVGNPSDLELVAPGGPLDDNIEIYSIYPLFQWESTDFMWTEGHCLECGYFIRVAEYNLAIHSSIDEALNDRANLPYPDNGLFYPLPSVIVAGGTGRGDLLTADNTFQYPFSDSKPLEDGKTYVWQIQKVFPTTSGSEMIESNIFVFSIPSMGGDDETDGATSGGSNIYLQILEQIIDADTYNALFSGELEGFFPTGVVTLNDTQQLTQDQLTALASQVLAGQISIKSIGVE